MSLFGGSGTSAESSSETASMESNSSDASSENLQDAQVASDQVPPEAADSASGGSAVEPNAGEGAQKSDDDLEDEESDDDVEARPNKYQGLPKKWLRWTAEERGLASSIEQIRAGELNVHLYNAHALEQQIHPVIENAQNVNQWQGKSRWRPKADRDEWTVSTAWTAWPLEPDRVPRPDEIFSKPPDDALENFTLRKQDGWKPSGELEDQLTAVMLEEARKRWDEREWADEDEEDGRTSRAIKRKGSISNVSARSASRASGRSVEGVSRALSRSHTPKGNDDSDDEKSSSTASHDDDVEMRSASQDDTHSISGQEDIENQISTKPVIMADEEKAHEILQPTVRSLLSRIDGLLMALHHTRKHQSTIKHARSRSASSATPKKSPKKRCRLDSGPQPSPDPSPESPPKPLFKPSEIVRLRKQQLADEDSDDPDYAATSSSSSPEVEPDRPAPRGRTQVTSADDSDATESDSEEALRSQAPRPRDWSEVLGLAAIQGWSPDVIRRASQRCSALFGEQMAFRVLPEAGPLETRAESEKSEALPIIPKKGKDAESNANAREDRDDDGNEDEHGHKGEQIEARDLHCPHTTCPRHTKPFKWPYELARHLRACSHRQTQPDDEMYGGVHVDGFLQPLELPGATRGKDKKKRKARVDGNVRRGSRSERNTPRGSSGTAKGKGKAKVDEKLLKGLEKELRGTEWQREYWRQRKAQQRREAKERTAQTGGEDD